MEIISKLPVEKITDDFAGRIEPNNSDKILWLHGYTGDSSIWGEMWSLLPGWYHIGIDLPGHGSSTPMAENSNLQDLGHRLGKLCIEQDIHHIVALSFGTITAIQIAIAFPDLYASIVLAAPTFTGGPQDPEMAKTYTRLIFFYRMVGPTQALLDYWMSSPALKGIERHPGLKEALYSVIANHSWTEMETYSKLQQYFYPPQKTDDIAKIQSPMLILIGEYEMPALKKAANIIAQQVSKCRIHELPDTHHLCMLQTPEQSALQIDAHLRKFATLAPHEK